MLEGLWWIYVKAMTNDLRARAAMLAYCTNSNHNNTPLQAPRHSYNSPSHFTMPPRRRATLPTTPDDIASLTLPQINARLERNERVLNTSLFSPTPHLASSPTSDPMRDRLIAIRASLLARKAELEHAANQQQLGGMSLEPRAESSAQAQRNSGSNGLPNGQGARSARARAMEIIEAGDKYLAPNSLQL